MISFHRKHYLGNNYELMITLGDISVCCAMSFYCSITPLNTSRKYFVVTIPLYSSLTLPRNQKGLGFVVFYGYNIIANDFIGKFGNS